MESASPPPSPECEICLNVYGPWRRAKLLECRHTCCSLCLGRMAAERPARDEPGANQSAAPAAEANRGEPGWGGCAVRCPWCRHVTALPAGLSVLHLPDDPDKMAGVAAAVAEVAPRTPAYTSVFIRLPSGHACYLLPPPGEVDRPGGGRGVWVVPKGRRMRGGPGEGHRLIGPGLVGVGQILEERERRVVGLGEGWTERRVEEEEVRRSMLWTRVCTVIVVGLGLFFLLCVILRVVTCKSSRFSIIGCA